MKKILAIGASSSTQSINQQWATYVAQQVKDATVNTLDLNDYEMPLYSIDREKEGGIPALAQAFKTQIEESDAIVLSLAEHNGTYTAAFKNVLDWASRLEGKLWANKPMFLMATSPGGRGGKTVLELAKNYLPFMGANVVSSFSLPSFYNNFNQDEGVTDAILRTQFASQLSEFTRAVERVATQLQD
ncbi:NADPH-dependent FMN reductase [marine bacterium AO1-C]|nr:NADPH-dependent FMN reductase [marine bacterium AO1-C]